MIRAAAPADLFADPFNDATDGGDGERPPPVLVVLDDGAEGATIREQRARLAAAADDQHVRVETVSSEAVTDVARYAALLTTGTYAAAYLGIGLGR